VALRSHLSAVVWLLGRNRGGGHRVEVRFSGGPEGVEG
jgi:hypothetical protein